MDHSTISELQLVVKIYRLQWNKQGNARRNR